MSTSEAYSAGDSDGWSAANFAVAYQDIARYSEAPAPTEYRSNITTDRQRWDYEAGYEAGWNRFMNEDYAE